MHAISQSARPSSHQVTQKTSPNHQNGPLQGTMNPNSLEDRHMNWSMPPPTHAQQSTQTSFDGDWMTALLNNNDFGQDSSHLMNGQTPSGSGSASTHGHGMNGQIASGSGSGSSHGHGVNGQQTLTEDMGPSWTPLFGSPRSTEAFSDQWGGTLIQMGGQVTGPVRDDFFS
jgi:hypothetical protein